MMLKSVNFNAETGRFHNSDGSENKKSPGQLFKMAKAFLTRAKDPLEDKGFDTLSPADQPDSLTGRQVTWVGHSTLLVSINGQHILTDPIFIGRASPFSFMGPKRAGKTPLAITELPPIDAVIISHNHYDHLSIPSLKALNELQPDIQYFVPLGLTDLLKKAGIIQITELDWWQSASHNNIEFTATPVHHWSSRRGFDRNETLWSGWMVKWPEFSFYFAGDTGYSSDFRETRKRLGTPDLATIPIGAYNPRPFMKASHVNPEEAVQIFTDLMPKQAVAVHWGTFKLTLEPLQEPPLRLTAALRNAGIEETRFLALQHGQKLHLE
jgi:L-ascorbate metabolism protein UlaG (beta-lactamase superfamily)